MSHQIIISIGREYGSAGHEIAEQLSKELNIPLYDRKMLETIAQHSNLEKDYLKKFDEQPPKPVFSRTVRGFSNSLEDNLAQMQFAYLKALADKGESFIVVGRCSETILHEQKGLISIFILGDREAKIAHVQKKFNVSRSEAIAKINQHDKNRKAYHNMYSKYRWGDSRAYDLCINSSRLGNALTVDILKKYIEERMQEQ